MQQWPECQEHVLEIQNPVIGKFGADQKNLKKLNLGRFDLFGCDM